ncbi:uncharacterized protein B0I36DRAFT_113518 [Microdochium trichocladiopsis]|uniref:Uncharacterized protein n=1 Tax=Microdochium trichocladiopsis TaxID=1682393 RepID=A0A9P8Y6C9_9PEZI|nr:uncharacterized protein B0I36DRAFT_113518 [Microdochium trichocladiopsis]KAH7030748.1 hypothetical protein B0I36DRAFT_113518 [Microdochium trichocladiopsis]
MKRSGHPPPTWPRLSFRRRRRPPIISSSHRPPKKKKRTQRHNSTKQTSASRHSLMVHLSRFSSVHLTSATIVTAGAALTCDAVDEAATRPVGTVPPPTTGVVEVTVAGAAAAAMAPAASCRGALLPAAARGAAVAKVAMVPRRASRAVGLNGDCILV